MKETHRQRQALGEKDPADPQKTGTQESWDHAERPAQMREQVRAWRSERTLAKGT